MPRAQVAARRIRSFTLLADAALHAPQGNLLAVGDGSRLQFILRSEMGVERAMRQAGGLQAWLSNFPETKGL